MRLTVTLGLLAVLSWVTSSHGFPTSTPSAAGTTRRTSSSQEWIDPHINDHGLVDPLENRGITLPYGELVEGDIVIPLGTHQSPREEPMAAAGTPEGYGWGYSGGASGVNPDRGWQDAPAAGPQMRTALPHLTWMDRLIPFVIDDGFNTTELVQIRLALREMTERSGGCISFIPRDLHISYIFITGALDGCNSYVGRQGGNQTVSISSAQNCVTKGIIMHELMHVLGFLHEHTRWDRDRYIQVNYDYIIPGKSSDFHINKDAQVSNITYDYYSIMHYKRNQFSLQKQRFNTIDILDPTANLEEVGQRKYLSEKDLTRIKTLYNCPLKKCSYPHTLNNGVVQVKQNTSVGSSIRYSCDSPNHVLIGATERTCMYDGMWSGSTPICFDTSTAVSYCNFEDPGLCGWTQDQSDEADWTRNSGQTPSESTGPIEDHTLQVPDGYYMYLEGTGLSPGTKARLSSTVISGLSDGCLLFWYNMYGAGMGTINVYLKSEGKLLDPVWTKSGNQGFGWKMELLTGFGLSVPFQVVIEATRGQQDTADIAIDDVIIGQCQDVLTYKEAVIRELREEYHNCDFNTEFCGWYQSANSTLTWYRHTGSTPSRFTGPTCDCNNCTACHNGSLCSYAYIETSGRKAHGDMAQLISPPFKSAGYTCIDFEYHMYGRDIGNLSLSLVERNVTALIWHVTGNQGNAWLQKQIQIYSTGKFEIAFTATSTGRYLGDIAVDDVILHSGKCPVLFHCDFDHHTLCDLYNVNSTDDFDWLFGSHMSSQSSTGPRSDHTSGNGQFLYIDASAPRLQGDTAKLLTPPFTSNGHCLTFWYYMYGRDVSTLKTLVRTNNGTEILLQEKQGSLGQKWLKSTINIPLPNTSIQVMFIAEVGSSYSSDIAIDDVQINTSKCN